MGFQAVIQSAASAASLGTQKNPNNPRKNVEKMKGKLFFVAFYIGNPGLVQKLKVLKWVCRSTLASVCNEPTLFAIFGPARGQIFGKEAEKNSKEPMDFCLFGPFI